MHLFYYDAQRIQFIIKTMTMLNVKAFCLNACTFPWCMLLIILLVVPGCGQHSIYLQHDQLNNNHHVITCQAQIKHATFLYASLVVCLYGHFQKLDSVMTKFTIFNNGISNNQTKGQDIIFRHLNLSAYQCCPQCTPALPDGNMPDTGSGSCTCSTGLCSVIQHTHRPVGRLILFVFTTGMSGCHGNSHQVSPSNQAMVHRNPNILLANR